MDISEDQFQYTTLQDQIVDLKNREKELCQVLEAIALR